MLRDLFSLFPAYAGVILYDTACNQLSYSFPRIRGGDPGAAAGFATATRFSPHTRG